MLPHSRAPLARALAGLALAGACSDSASTTESGDNDTGQTSGSSATTGATSTSTSASASDGPDSTGAPAECGNGVVESGEQCDDANDEPGDGCEPGCLLPSGDDVWTVEHDGPEGLDDWANDVVVRPNGEIVVAGFESTADGRRNLWVAGYASDGTQSWSASRDYGMGLRDEARGLALDEAGNLVIAGYVEIVVDPPDDDILLAKLDGAGEEIWATTVAGSDALVDSAEAVAVAPSGELVVVGELRSTASDYDAWISKRDADGNEIWAVARDSGEDENDGAEGVALTADGGLVVVGWRSDGTIETDMWIMGLDADGNEVWSDSIDGGFGDDDAFAVAVDADGTIVVTGVYANARDNSEDVWLARYSPDGVQTWSTTWNSGGFDYDAGFDVAIDEAGGIYVAGTGAERNQQGNVFAGRYDRMTELWTHMVDGGAGLEDAAEGVAVVPGGGVIVVGGVTVIGQGTNAWLRLYAP